MLKTATIDRHDDHIGLRVLATHPFSPTRSWYCKISVCSSSSSSKVKPSNSWQGKAKHKREVGEESEQLTKQ